MKIYAYWTSLEYSPMLMFITDRTIVESWVFAGEFEIDESKLIPLSNNSVIESLEAEKTKIRAEMTAKITAIDDRIQNLLALPGAA